MKHIPFLIVVGTIISALGLAQEAPNRTDATGKKQGHWIKYDADHKKIYDGNFVDNIPIGKFIYFYDTGIPWSISVFSHNGKQTHSQMFDAGGKLIGEGNYLNEKKDSTWKFYSAEGNLLSDEIYTNGLKNGSSRVYYANETISEEKIWQNGSLNGSVKKYFENGQLKYSGNYINNKLDGNVVFYYPSGKIDAKGLYKNDLKEGSWKYYNEDGTLKRTDIYIDGKMTGTDKDIITKEQEETEKKNFQQFEVPDPFQENYHPQ